MTLTDQKNHIAKFQAKQAEILNLKGNDYASTDRLLNFKNTAYIVQTTPELVCLTMIGIKVSRLGVLLSGSEPENESVRDSVMDLANYAVLLDQILSEK